MYGTSTKAAAPQYAGVAQYAGVPAYGGQLMETVAAPVSYATAPTYATAAPAYTTQTYASPTVLETMAAPVTYAAPMSYAAPQVAPAVTYAQPMSYAAPMVETIAAPVTYAAPQFTTQVPSYVAAPVAMPTTQVINVPQAPMQPMKLTEGIPTPDQIGAQKAGYSAALDKQLKEAIETVQKETQIEKEMIKFTAEKTIALYNLQVEETLTEAMATADEQATFALLELNKAKVERNLQLSSQASGLVMDYQMKAIQTELAQKQWELHELVTNPEGEFAKQYMTQVHVAILGELFARVCKAVGKK